MSRTWYVTVNTLQNKRSRFRLAEATAQAAVSVELTWVALVCRTKVGGRTKRFDQKMTVQIATVSLLLATLLINDIAYLLSGGSKFAIIQFCRLEPICRGLDWRGALATVARWRHLSFRALRAAVNGIMFCVEPPHQPFNQFFCCYPLYLEFNQRKSVGVTNRGG